MVVSKADVKCENGSHGSHSDEQNHAADEEMAEFTTAVETVLPHLLGHAISSKKYMKAALSLQAEENLPKTYVDAVYDFGRWIGTIGNYFRRNTSEARKRKLAVVPLTSSSLKDFLILLEDVRIKRFLNQDKCKIFADSYLLAMVFAYFLRAGYTNVEYNYQNFYTALVLAHEMEEENGAVDVLVVEFETEALQTNEEDFIPINRLRYELFVRMDFRAVVSRKFCEEIMAIYPEHWAWKRKRPEHHSGVYQDTRYPMQRCVANRSLRQWASVHDLFFQICEPCLKLEKINAVILANMSERKTGGKRLTLKKRQNSPQDAKTKQSKL